jgi:hypothetical protein
MKNCPRSQGRMCFHTQKQRGHFSCIGRREKQSFKNISRSSNSLNRQLYEAAARSVEALERWQSRAINRSRSFQNRRSARRRQSEMSLQYWRLIEEIALRGADLLRIDRFLDRTIRETTRFRVTESDSIRELIGRRVKRLCKLRSNAADLQSSLYGGKMMPPHALIDLKSVFDFGQ